MVDAINAVNPAIRSIIQNRKDMAIDWRKLTANEVLEYAGQGEDVPADILRWAEDYSKAINAPDNVTYEAANGAVDTEEAKATDETSKTEENSGENNEETDGESDDVSTEPAVSLYQQAGTLIKESGAAGKEVRRAAIDANIKASQGEKVAKNATEEAKVIEFITRTRKAEYDKLVREMQSDKAKITPENLMKLDRLSGQLMSVGRQAQTQLTVYDSQLQEIESVFSQYSQMTDEASNKGSETVEVGSQLVTNNSSQQTDIQNRAKSFANKEHGKFIFKPSVVNVDLLQVTNKDYLRGMHAISAGTKTMSDSSDTEGVLTRGNEINQNSEAQIVDAMDKVEDITFVEGNRFNLNNENEETTQNEENTSESTSEKSASRRTEKSNTESTANKTDNNGVKDSAILTDPLEIERRKANRGENIPIQQA